MQEVLSCIEKEGWIDARRALLVQRMMYKAPWRSIRASFFFFILKLYVPFFVPKIQLRR